MDHEQANDKLAFDSERVLLRKAKNKLDEVMRK